MLPWIIVLIILGLMLVFAEILIPGFGIFGIMGAVALLISLVLVANMYGTAAFVIVLLIIIALFFLMIFIAKKSGLYSKVVLHDRQEAKDFDESKLAGLIGKIGYTYSTLRPFGIAEFDGKSVDVCSQGDFIDRGKRVKVVEVTGKTVTVKEDPEE